MPLCTYPLALKNSVAFRALYHSDQWSGLSCGIIVPNLNSRCLNNDGSGCPYVPPVQLLVYFTDPGALMIRGSGMWFSVRPDWLRDGPKRGSRLGPPAASEIGPAETGW